MDTELQGKLRELFGIPIKLIPKLRIQCNELYARMKKTKNNSAHYEDIHMLIINLFNSDYYPLVSRNIKIDDNNITIIMGGIAFNMNIPPKLAFLKLDTDDFDLKIYTTGISYKYSSNNMPTAETKTAISKVLSVFKFSVLIICMFLRQIFHYLSNFQPGLHEPRRITRDSRRITKIKKITYGKSKTKASGSASGIFGGGSSNNRKVNLLGKYELILQIKKKDEVSKIYHPMETIDLTNMSYTDIYTRIINVVDHPELLITNKISYETNKTNKFRVLTFSDCKIIYAGLDSPAFFGQYLESNQHDLNKSLDQLISMQLPINKIMDIKNCANNCRFMSLKSLIIDTVLMLSYADLLAYEKLDNGGQVLVPAAFIFKYYKYLVKFVRLMVIKKFFSGTLKGKFFESAKALWQYALIDLQRKAAQLKPSLDEYDKINVVYKNFLNDFHQNLFHNRILIMNKYSELMEIANEYENIVFYINKSRNLFSELNDKSVTVGETIESVTIQYANQEIIKYESQKHSSKTRIGGGSSKSVKSISLFAEDYDYEDMELDNLDKEHILVRNVIKKIRKMMTDEVDFYSRLSHTKSSKAKSSKAKSSN